MLYIIGLGLGDEKDISVKGLETVKKCEYVFLESYTSILVNTSIKNLEKFFEKKIIEADRNDVESECEDLILEKSRKHNVAFLVIGDPFAATTHSDIYLRAVKMGIKVKIIHNTSIMSAIGMCGIQLYNFGQTVSLCFFTEKWKPESFYQKIKNNSSINLHTLCLLDIKLKERSIENLMRNKKIYEKPRFMTVNVAIKQLMEIEEKRKEKVYSWDTYVVGLARVGSDDQTVVYGKMKDVVKVDFGEPVHSLIVCCEKSLHEIEKEHLELYDVSKFKKLDEKKK